MFCYPLNNEALDPFRMFYIGGKLHLCMYVIFMYVYVYVCIRNNGVRKSSKVRGLAFLLLTIHQKVLHSQL